MIHLQQPKRPMRKQLSVLFLNMLACGVVLHAQHFRWEAPVMPADSTGYTRILLQPEVTSGMHASFADVRIYDMDSVEIPYLGVLDRVVKGTQRFVEYPVTDKHESPGHSWITVENPLYKTDPLNHLVLEVNNTDVKREMSLSGSYDGVNWYAVKDEFYFSFHETYRDNKETTTRLVQFDFPNSDYRYFRFNFNNWGDWWIGHRAPVFVVRAGILIKTNTASVKDNWLEVPAPAITQTENVQQKTSEVHMLFTDEHFVDHIRFTLSTTNPNGKFFRGARLYAITEDSINGKRVQQERLLSSAILSADALNEMNVGGKVKHLLLRIVNEDDQPVRVDAAQAIQVKHYLLAYLEKDKRYVLRFGNDTVYAPKYDLRYQEDSLVTYELPVVTTGARIARAPQAPEVEAYSLWKDRRLIWAAFAVVVALLGWMSVKMLREMKGGRQ